MEYSTKTRNELIKYCKEKNIKSYSSKTKNEIIEMLVFLTDISNTIPEKIHRLNYIGSKFQLLELDFYKYKRKNRMVFI